MFCHLMTSIKYVALLLVIKKQLILEKNEENTKGACNIYVTIDEK